MVRARYDGTLSVSHDEIKMELRSQLASVRDRTLWLLDKVSDDFLRRRVHEFYSPIGWHFGHVGRTEEYWVIVEALQKAPRDQALSFLLADLADNPKDNRVNIPDREGLLQYLKQTRDDVLEALDSADLDAENPLTRDGYGWSFAIQHECQHQETIAEMLTLISQKQEDFSLPAPFEWKSNLPTNFVSLEGGTFCMGSDDPFAYDNEHDSHSVSLAGFELAKYPVTAYQWTKFMEDGGYHTEGLWSEEGWDWKKKQQADRPEYWLDHEDGWFAFSPIGPRAIHPDEPANCISWFEAEAYAKWSGARLPTEEEWEFAARASSGGSQLYPWGDARPDRERAGFWLNGWGPDPVDSHPLGATASGIEGLAGGVWEWTSSPFLPYPGFQAFPYDGYSKDHMRGSHKTCRGGSWATSEPILRSCFRNWYVPTYRQGFLGMRLARS